jgi:hypothetical protein
VRILIDENLPRYLVTVLTDYEIKTVQETGWSGIKNGPLIVRAEGQFDIFITGDKNLRYQQNLVGRKLIIIVLPSNRLSTVKSLVDQLKTKIAESQVGDYIEL